jgi:hypothetical protein
MRIVKVVFITLLFLVIAAALAWCVVYYLVWPKPETLGLVPSTPLFLVAASDLDETLSAVEGSEFIDRVGRSPLWRDFKSSRLWLQARLQKRAWERQTGLLINPEVIMQLVGKDAILAFYGGQRPWSFLLISEVGLTTRLNIMSRSTKRMLASRHEFTIGKYKGIELMTLAVPGLEFSYGFIGRTGLLSTDKSLLKEAVDLYRGSGQGLAAAPELKGPLADLPGPDAFFYINLANIQDAAGFILRASPFRAPDVTADPRLRYLASAARHIDVWTGVGFRQDGNVRLDQSFLYKRNNTSTRRELPYPLSPIHSDSAMDDRLVVPTDCLLFMLYRTLKPGFLFEMLRTVVGRDIDVIREKLVPVLRSGAAVAVLEPNIKELQLLPPVMSFFRVKDRAIAQTALEDLKGSLKIGRRQLQFAEIKHEDIAINYTRLPIGMGMSIDVGYAFIGDDLLVVASDTSALEAAIDVALGKRQSLMEDEQYTNVLSPIVGAGFKPAATRYTDGRIFINIRSAAIMTKQAAKLYAWRAKIAGEHEAERVATMLYENAFMLEAWHYIGATFSSDSDRANVRLILDAGY